MPTPSITYWNRLEPRPRAPAIDAGLAARVRDPLWLLTRQWQVGEFHGEDAGSPAYVELSARVGPITGWRAEGQATQSFAGDAPLERLAESEPFTPDLSTRVELGQTFEALLTQAGAPASLITAFRAAYPVQLPDEALLAASPDQETARFLRVCAGRTIDGVALYQAARAAGAGLPPRPPVGITQRAAVQAALSQFQDWVLQVFGDLGTADPPAWKPERLEYGVEALAAQPTGGVAVLPVYPDPDGGLGWHAFDLQGSAAGSPAPPTGTVQTIRRSTLPANVRFHGMPNRRWWSFERGTTDFGAITTDKRDLARLIVMDFMLVHGNDWFLIPFEQPVGSLCHVDALVVHDVFGGATLVERADGGRAPASGSRWTMFSTSIAGGSGQLADFFILPPSAATAIQHGPAVEEVRFLRDEVANYVWAVEHATEDGVGQPWLGHERDLAASASAPPRVTPPPGRNGQVRPSLRYQIQTTVPTNWIPFLPVVIDPAQGEIALERGAMLGPDGVTAVEPLGRILRPTSLRGAAYRIREEEVPRTGVGVQRVVCRTRWIDGSTHLWIVRQKSAGTGEGSSGLRFDLAVPVE